MTTLIGILVDVSYSMRKSVGDGVDQEGGTWARSIFKVVDELIKHDVSSSTQTFALAFGGSHCEVFDLLSTVGNVAQEDQYSCKWGQSSMEDLRSRKSTVCNVAQDDQSSIEDLRSRRSGGAMIEDILTILERNGAWRVRTWAKMDVLLEVVHDTTAARILHFLQKSSDFAKRFVKECLPEECHKLPEDNVGKLKEYCYFTAGWVPVFGSGLQASATKDSIRQAIWKGEKLVAETMKASVKTETTKNTEKMVEIMKPTIKMVCVSKAAIKSVQNASELLHAGIGDQDLTNKQVDELLKVVEPYIYGRTPLMQAMHHSVDLFSYTEFANQKKLLFILSDGKPNDGDNPPLQKLFDLGVTIVSCFITNQQLSDPRHLYSILDERWEKPAKVMFGMSSTIATQEIPRTLFVKRGWKIDIDNNETRLFFQVNHPEIIKDVCGMAKEAVLSQDALSDILSSVHLDIYITRKNQRFGAKKQPDDEATCYAYASAAVLHLAMKRIVGRDGGYPDFYELRDKLIAEYGISGARTIKVLEEICPKYRLQCKQVDAKGAMKAISKKRPVVARFSLTGAQWDQFYQFYEENPKGILTRSFLDSGSHRTSTPPHGHAVVLTSYDSESLRLMNSEGVGFADFGFFRVQNADVLGLEFVDVLWKLVNLSEQEKRAYEQHGAEVAAKVIRSLKGIQVAQYKCPKCGVESKVVDYSGHLLEAKCPECRETFNANEAGGDLALNLYLTSLTY